MVNISNAADYIVNFGEYFTYERYEKFCFRLQPVVI